MRELGEFVRSARMRIGLSGQELADRAGWSLRSIYNIERGQQPASDKALEALPASLELSAFETYYLTALAGRVMPPPKIEDSPIQPYLDGANPNLAALMSPDWTAQAWNSRWENVFHGLWLAPNLGQWLYATTAARRTIANWDWAAKWTVSQMRFEFAVNPEAVWPMLRSLLAMDSFRAEWDAQVIPVNPASQPWLINDPGGSGLMTVHMRSWRASAGVLALGTVAAD